MLTSGHTLSPASTRRRTAITHQVPSATDLSSCSDADDTRYDDDGKKRAVGVVARDGGVVFC